MRYSSGGFAKIVFAAIFFSSHFAGADLLATAQQDAERISASKPVPPAAPNCGTDTTTTTYVKCQQEYNIKLSAYNHDLSIYNQSTADTNKANQDTAAAAAQAQAQAAAQAAAQAQSATGTMAQIESKSNSNATMFRTLGMAAAAYGVYKIGVAGFCFSTCSLAGTGCCGTAPYWMAGGAALMILSNNQKKQADSATRAANQACSAYNQMSSVQKTCAPAGANVTESNVTIGPNGACQPADSDACKLNPSAGPLPPNVRDAGGASAMAAGKFNNFAELQPDGSVKFKNGKTFKPSDFNSVESLIAAGLSPEDAQKLFNELNSGPLAQASADANKALKDLAKAGAGGALGSGSGANVVNVDKGLDSGKVFSDKLKATESSMDDRKPSSEGLAKEFNGELIGVSGDNIFMMMNRRYKLKNEQDSFILSEATK